MAQRHDRVDGLGTVLALLTCVQHHENGKQAEGEPGIEQTPDAVAAVARQRGAHERPRQQPVALQVRLRRHGAVLPLVRRQQPVQRPECQLVWHLCTATFRRLQRRLQRSSRGGQLAIDDDASQFVCLVGSVSVRVHRHSVTPSMGHLCGIQPVDMHGAGWQVPDCICVTAPGCCGVRASGV